MSVNGSRFVNISYRIASVCESVLLTYLQGIVSLVYLYCQHDQKRTVNNMKWVDLQIKLQKRNNYQVFKIRISNAVFPAKSEQTILCQQFTSFNSRTHRLHNISREEYLISVKCNKIGLAFEKEVDVKLSYHPSSPLTYFRRGLNLGSCFVRIVVII